MRYWPRIGLLYFAGFVLALLGCGYRAELSGTSLRGHLNTLAIPTVESPATVAGIEADFTNIIRQEFLSHSTIPIVPRKEASALLVGKIKRIDTSPLSYNIQKTEVSGETVAYETTNLRRIRVRMSVKMINRRTGEVLWEAEDLEEKSSYAVSDDPLENQYRERMALMEIAGLLAKRIYLKTADIF
ncbi:MAG: hypothetical protein DRH12_01640 [Deltaproteobacteria bacterium]|nr:MAG: hypothetical protein DRH12_01640 [Deltaproteobacteria bacterium]RLB86985.1 MAG: hypothetical protein DRH15_00010 [Deltaproteobacteria bacterium]